MFFLEVNQVLMYIFAWEKKGVISNSKRLKNLVSGRNEGSHDAKQFARLVIRYTLPFIVFIKSISAVLINMHNDMYRQAQPNPLFRSACKKYQNYEHPLYIFKTRTDLKEKYLGRWLWNSNDVFGKIIRGLSNFNVKANCKTRSFKKTWCRYLVFLK